MNKWQIICPVALAAFIGGIVVVQWAATEGRTMKNAIDRSIAGHSSQIADILTTMSTNDTSSVEDAVYLELQRGPSTSLITRVDVRVRRAPGGPKCVINTGRRGIAPIEIRQSTLAATQPAGPQ
jgi:hypothetical protein